jgi:hypothetical protein
MRPSLAKGLIIHRGLTNEKAVAAATALRYARNVPPEGHRDIASARLWTTLARRRGDNKELYVPDERSLNGSNQAISMRWNERSQPVGERNVGDSFRRRDVGRRAVVYPEQAGTAALTASARVGQTPTNRPQSFPDRWDSLLGNGPF